MDAMLMGLLWFETALLAAGSVFAAWRARRLRATIGRPLARELPRRRLRAALVAAVALLAALVAVLPAASGLPRPLLAAVLLLSAALLLLGPGFQDAVWGEDGVQRGWYARRYAELEEWRLTGDHLRWKLRGTWVASPVPAREHAALREKLERLCPGRESRFRS